MSPRRSLLALVLAFAGCSSGTRPEQAPAPARRSGKIISDQLNSSGRFGFAWEPPMVTAYDPTPGMRTDVPPVVYVDEIDTSAASDTIARRVMTFTSTGICPPPAAPAQPSGYL